MVIQGVVILGACFVLGFGALWRFLDFFWWRPRALAAQLSKQGLRGPPPRFLVGHSNQIQEMRSAVRHRDMDGFRHDIVERAMPDYCLWSKQYGKRYVFWWGTEPRITITEPELIREVLSKKISHFEKSEIMVAGLTPLLGRGLVVVNGDEWSHHRRLVSPAFYQERLKRMTAIAAACTSSMLDRWEAVLQEQSEIEVCADIQKLTADIISHTAFGSSYEKGQKIFDILSRRTPELITKLSHVTWLPGYRFLPLKANFELTKVHRELDSLITGIIDERRDSVKRRRSTSYGHDLLGLMLEECERDTSFTIKDLIEESKTFYLAGHETTARLLSWTMMLLAAYPEWQDRAREEAQQVCGDGTPDGDDLSKLKLIGMIIHESLRLYPPASQVARGCLQDTWLQDLYVPKGVGVVFPIAAIHHDKYLWGEDADEFKPERFRDGITAACKHPNAFMPFSFGPRVCVGQSLVMIEAKVALVTILRRFSFQLSPNYRHNPAQKVGLKPIHGILLNMTNLRELQTI